MPVAPLGAAPAPTPAAAPEVPTFSAGAPVLLNPAPDGVSVVCVLRTPATGWVEYGETAALGLRCDARAHGFLAYDEKALAVRLEGLRPGASNFYRLHLVAVEFNAAGRRAQRAATGTTETRSFRTLDPAAPTARLSVWNDPHENRDTVRALVARHREQPSDVLVWNGFVPADIVSDQMMLDDYLCPAGRPFAATTPFFLSRGNHDVRGRAARWLPHHGPGARGQYYTLRQDPLARVVLEAGDDKPDATHS